MKPICSALVDKGHNITAFVFNAVMREPDKSQNLAVPVDIVPFTECFSLLRAALRQLYLGLVLIR